MAGLIAVSLRNKRLREKQAKLDAAAAADSESEEDRLSLPPNYYRQPKNIRPPVHEVNGKILVTSHPFPFEYPFSFFFDVTL